MHFVRHKFRRIEHNFSNLSFVRVWHLSKTQQMTQRQIFTAQTVLMRHLLYEIWISYLYTWYVLKIDVTDELVEFCAGCDDVV